MAHNPLWQTWYISHVPQDCVEHQIYTPKENNVVTHLWTHQEICFHMVICKITRKITGLCNIQKIYFCQQGTRCDLSQVFFSISQSLQVFTFDIHWNLLCQCGSQKTVLVLKCWFGHCSPNYSGLVVGAVHFLSQCFQWFQQGCFHQSWNQIQSQNLEQHCQCQLWQEPMLSLWCFQYCLLVDHSDSLPMFLVLWQFLVDFDMHVFLVHCLCLGLWFGFWASWLCTEFHPSVTSQIYQHTGKYWDFGLICDQTMPWSVSYCTCYEQAWWFLSLWYFDWCNFLTILLFHWVFSWTWTMCFCPNFASYTTQDLTDFWTSGLELATTCHCWGSNVTDTFSSCKLDSIYHPYSLAWNLKMDALHHGDSLSIHPCTSQDIHRLSLCHRQSQSLFFSCCESSRFLFCRSSILCCTGLCFAGKCILHLDP